MFLEDTDDFIDTEVDQDDVALIGLLGQLSDKLNESEADDEDEDGSDEGEKPEAETTEAASDDTKPAAEAGGGLLSQLTRRGPQPAGASGAPKFAVGGSDAASEKPAKQGDKKVKKPHEGKSDTDPPPEKPPVYRPQISTALSTPATRALMGTENWQRRRGYIEAAFDRQRKGQPARIGSAVSDWETVAANEASGACGVTKLELGRFTKLLISALKRRVDENKADEYREQFVGS